MTETKTTSTSPAATSPAATIVLGAGAPNAPLMSGFLDAIYSANKAFNNFFTAGGGALIGLSLIAPRQDDPLKNLRSILDSAVADEIYNRLSVNYKVFRKNSPFMEPMQQWFNQFKGVGAFIPNERAQRVYSDLVDLWAVMATPGGIPGVKAPSVCAPFALLPKLVDFKKLEEFQKQGMYRMNAYNIDTGKIELFPKRNPIIKGEFIPLDEEQFIAGLSYPFIYPPGELNGRLYYEGADVDPLCIFQLIKTIMQMRGKHSPDDVNPPEEYIRHFQTQTKSNPQGRKHTIVMVDILGTLGRAIVRKPRGLWDAYGISMLTSIVSSARWSKELFRAMYMTQDYKKKYKVNNEFLEEEIDDVRTFNNFLRYDIEVRQASDSPDSGESMYYDFHEIRFDVPQSHWPKLMDWSYSNLSLCYEIGKMTGELWLNQKDKGTDLCNGDLLPSRQPRTIFPEKTAGT